MTEINDAEKRPFKGIWVPVDVWQDQRLTKCELCLLMEINSLDGKDGCYATNQYFADFLNTTQRSVSRSLSKLIELEYVKIEKPDGSKRVLRSCLAKKEKNDPKGVDKNVVGGRQNCLGGVTKLSRGGDKIVTQNNNNIYNNNIINNNLSLKKEELSPYGDNKKESFPEGFSPEITLDEMFRQFWELYPRQRRYAPKKVKPKFEALLRSGEITFPELLSRVRAYAQSREVQQGYAKMPETWFNQQCWMKPDWDGNEIKAGGIISRWNILAEKHNLQTIDSLTNERTTKFNEEAKKLNLTLDEVFTQLDRHLKLSMRLRGKKQIKIAPGEYDIVNDEWRATLGFFLDKNNLARTLEGTFDDPDLVRFEEHKKQEAQEREREQAEREKQIQAEKEKIKQYRISIGLPPEET